MHTPAPLDFETVTNPLGPPPAVKEVLASFDASSTPPDPEWRVLREALATRLHLPIEQVWAGDGLLEATARAFIRPKQRTLVFTPAPTAYVDAVLAAAGEMVEYPAQREGRGGPPRWSWGDADALRGLRTAYAVLGRPSDPFGSCLGLARSAKVSAFLRALGPSPLLLDESLAPFVDGIEDSLPLLAEHSNLLVLRSLQREYGLGSLAVEYVVGPAPLIERVRAEATKGSHGPMMAVLQVAGLTSLEKDGDHARWGRMRAHEGAAILRRGLTEAGLTVASPEEASYVLLRTPGDASATTQALLERGYRVLDCTPLGLPSHIRIAARRADMCEQLLDEIIDVVSV